jgi:hypothetical protein
LTFSVNLFFQAFIVYKNVQSLLIKQVAYHVPRRLEMLVL